MKQKRSLIISDPLSDEILKIAPSTSIYLDEHFYKLFMNDHETASKTDLGEVFTCLPWNKRNVRYSVNIEGIYVGWILKDMDGEGI
jgi:hypothetical protein